LRKRACLSREAGLNVCGKKIARSRVARRAYPMRLFQIWDSGRGIAQTKFVGAKVVAFLKGLRATVSSRNAALRLLYPRERQ